MSALKIKNKKSFGQLTVLTKIIVVIAYLLKSCKNILLYISKKKKKKKKILKILTEVMCGLPTIYKLLIKATSK
jgi:ABC-type phosphate transport system permease subunit